MRVPGGEADAYVAARRGLLDALEALGRHAGGVVVIGAQAVYLHTGSAEVAVAPFTSDADLVVDPRTLGSEPTLEQAMRHAGFSLDPEKNQPGAWLSASGVPVDLMVPEALAGPAGSQRRGARIPPHSKRATRRAVGIEAAVIDHAPVEIAGFGEDDRRTVANVAGPAALLVAKLHKLSERVDDPDRLFPKDAHDVYRLLVRSETDGLVSVFDDLLATPLTADVTRVAIEHLDGLFAAGPQALGSSMAGQAEAGVGDPLTAAQASSFLAADLITALNDRQ